MIGRDGCFCLRLSIVIHAMFMLIGRGMILFIMHVVTSEVRFESNSQTLNLRRQLMIALSQYPVSRQVKVGSLGSGSLYPSLQLKVQVSLTFLPSTTKQFLGVTEVPVASTSRGHAISKCGSKNDFFTKCLF